MVTQDRIVTIILSPAEMRFVTLHAARACIGGQSEIREDNRQSTLSGDQMVGQIGTLAGHKWYCGHPLDYLLSRAYANRAPTVGDGGADISMSNIDFKASLMRRSQNPLDYRLPLRPKERHDDWVYILALVAKYTEEEATVHLVGWADTKMFPQQVESSGPFSGAYVLAAKDLNPLPPLRWTWFK